MTDPRIQLAQKFSQQNRYANFGACLTSLRALGFRGITDLSVDFKFPITAISGLNGAGKSTLGQLALAAYKKPSTSKIKRFYVRDFFPASAADPSPFTSDASIIYKYNTDTPGTPQDLTVTRTQKEWSGYKRQPERTCYYIGFTLYIPKVEQRDLSIRNGANIHLANRRPISDDIRKKVGVILGQKYDAMHFQGITHGKKNAELGIAARFGAQYSENNMGFGEGRTLYMVDMMEKSPEQSLFVIEEPETSLHGTAQFELIKYFLDVCNRRHHQIVITTHSSTILEALPESARLMLFRDSTGVTAYPGLSAARAKSILTNGRQREVTVLVEDNFAKQLLTEIIRRIDPHVLQPIEIHEIGDANAVATGARLLKKIGRKFIAVRDADKGPSHSEGLYCLPGSTPPEKEVFLRASVSAALQAKFGICVEDVLFSSQVTEHHDYSKTLAKAGNTSREFIELTAIDAYLDDLGEDEIRPLVSAIDACTRQQ